MQVDIDLDHPTPAEKAGAIQALRAKLPEALNRYCSDLDIWRFSVARQLDVDKAAEMIKDWYKWRVDGRIDDLPVAQADNAYPVPCSVRGFYSVADANLVAGSKVKEYQLRLNRYYGGGCWHKQDRDGHPVYIERIGRYRLNKLTSSATSQELYTDHYLAQEFLNRTVLPECTRMAGREISKQVVVFDLAGVSLSMLSHIPSLNVLREVLAADQLRYPERMHLTYVVNAPAMFVTAWNMIKGWLDPRVIGKVRILGKGHAKELLAQIAPENLPAFLGGSCRCSHMSGGCVPSIPLNNVIALPPPAFARLQHQARLSYAEPKHTHIYSITNTPVDPDGVGASPIPSPSAPSTPKINYAAWLGLKKEPAGGADEREREPRVVCIRFAADGGRGVVVEVVWTSFGIAAEEEILVYPETLFDPQRAPVLVEVEVPKKAAGELTVNWRIASLDEGLAPFPSMEEAQVPITLEYSIDPTEQLLAEYSLKPIDRRDV